MKLAYREDELLDALIIDSEGYVYGKVERVNIKEDEVTLLAYEDMPDEKTSIDVASLKEELLKGTKKTLLSRIRRANSAEILAGHIRKELELKPSEELNDDHYVKYAQRLDFPTPYAKTSVDRKEQKGTVNLSEVKTIKITVMGKDKDTRVIKAVILHDPKEAAFRKIPVQETVTYRGTNAVRDKLVLDAEGTALGYTDSVVLFHGTPGIRVYALRMSGKVNLNLLVKYLEESGQGNVVALLRKHFANLESHRYTVETDELEDFMYQMRIVFRLPEKLVTDQRAKEFVADIPWNSIHKIGDVILLNSTLADLRMKGYL